MEPKITIFISYKHDKNDERIKKELYEFVQPALSTLDVNIWMDNFILPGSFWDREIKNKLAETDIALILVSQQYLGSKYIQGVEIPAFINKRVEEGMIIFPIILSPCTWEIYGWLKETQFLPRDGKNIEQDFTQPGKRKALYKEITNDLMILVKDLRGTYQGIQSSTQKLYCGRCGESNHWDEKSPLCKSCGHLLEPPFRLVIDGKEVFLNHDTVIYPYHFDIHKYKLKTPIACLTQHPSQPSAWGLTNNSGQEWIRISPNGRRRTISPDETLLLEVGTKIEFASWGKGLIR
jgi:hypothetical protein